MNHSNVIEFIRVEVLPLCVTDAGSTNVDVQLKGSVLRPNSQVWFADIADGDKQIPIVVKCVTMLSSTPNQRRPRITPTVPVELMITRQGRALSAIDDILEAENDPRFMGVRVLLSDERRRILVMTRIPGIELLTRLHAAAGPFSTPAEKDLISYSRLAGDWLRLFHQRMNLEPGIRMSRNSADYYDQAVEWLEQVGWDDIKWRKGLERHLKLLSDSIDPNARALLHGDYWVGNILVDRERIGVIDVLGWTEGSVWMDISYYILHLRAVVRQIWLHNVGWSTKVQDQTEKVFLEAYFGDSNIDWRSRDFFFAYALLAKWASANQVSHETSGIKSLKKSALLSWKSAYYRKLLSSLPSSVD